MWKNKNVEGEEEEKRKGKQQKGEKTSPIFQRLGDGIE